MICPLLELGAFYDKDAPREDATECLGKNCAWWLPDIQMCAIKDLALESRYIQQRLADLVEAVRVIGRKVGLK